MSDQGGVHVLEARRGVVESTSATASGNGAAEASRGARRGPPAPVGALASPLDQAGIIALAARINEQEILRHLGGIAEIGADGVVRVGLREIQPFHVGGMETAAINGPVILAMLDCALVSAGLVQFSGERCATMEMSVKIMRPVLPRDVRAVGYAISKAKNIVFTRADVYDVRNQVRATATGIVTKL